MAFLIRSRPSLRSPAWSSRCNQKFHEYQASVKAGAAHSGCDNEGVNDQTLPHVTLAGDRTGECRIAEEHADGTLVLRPDTSVDAIFRRAGAEPATLAGAEYGPVGEPDGEG